MKNLLVVLTAKYVGEDLQKMFGKVVPTLLPYGNETILSSLVKGNGQKFDIEAITFEGRNLVEQYVQENKLDVKIKVPSELGNLASSALNANLSDYENVTFILGDTLIKDFSLESYVGDKIGFGIVTEPEQWTTFTIEDNEIVVFDKEQRELQEEYDAFMGVYSFSKPNLVKELLEQTNDFYEMIKLYNQKQKLEFVNEENWLDFGHSEELEKSFSNDVEARFFNEIIIDRDCGKLTKKSIEKDKFINEIKWYLKMPKELEYLTPRIFDFSTSYENPFIEMEYYSYPTLHNIFVHGNYSIQKWDKILDLLMNTHNKMAKYKLSLDKEQVDASLKKIYVDKTLERFAKLQEDEEFADLFKNEVTINGTKYPSLAEISEMLPKVVKEKLLNCDELSLIHGDYFFANILYDGQSNFLRLIDPRGDFGGYGVYGDSRYDIAKLSHSVNGKYDFIVSDKFKVSKTGTEIEYKIQSSDEHEKIKELFFGKLGNKLDEILLIESLLFLSMVPLHSDYPERQKVMISVGIENFMKSINN